jgi:hypothetical protein
VQCRSQGCSLVLVIQLVYYENRFLWKNFTSFLFFTLLVIQLVVEFYHGKKIHNARMPHLLIDCDLSLTYNSTADTHGCHTYLL